MSNQTPLEAKQAALQGFENIFQLLSVGTFQGQHAEAVVNAKQNISIMAKALAEEIGIKPEEEATDVKE